MFADLWIISALIIYAASGFLLFRALAPAVQIMKHWDSSSSSSLQLQLERKNYLVSVLLQYALLFQIILLVFFLQLVNVHLPQLIKGAMCAAGALSLNAYGYASLFTKAGALFIYGAFLFINYLDQSEHGFPLTPKKYGLLFLAVVVFICDFFVTFSYFAQINPDVIATCCSVNIDFNALVSSANIEAHLSVPVLLAGFYTVGFLILAALLAGKERWLAAALLLSVIFVYIDLNVLKYHFVKFIYELPSHNCLFDIFWAEYYYAGYWIFGALALHLLTLLMRIILGIVKTKTGLRRKRLSAKLKWLSAAGLLIHMIILSAYWARWVLL